MTIKTVLARLIAGTQTETGGGALQLATRPQRAALACPAPPPVVIIPGYPALAAPKLSQLILIGRRFHDLAAPGSFVDRIEFGYYDYEKRVTWETCPLAAAYVGAFGPGVVEVPFFSYTQMIYRLGKFLDYNLETPTTGPTGETLGLASLIVNLRDRHYWDDRGIVEFLQENHL